MNKTIFKRMALMAAIIAASVQGMQAQSVLDDLTFEAPTKFVRPTGNKVNVRTTPATSGQKAGSALRTMVYPVLEEKAQWYRIGGNDEMFFADECNNGWVSKTVAKEEAAKPITPDMLNRYFGWCESYDWANEWMVSTPVGNHDLTLMITPFALYLGKRVGEVFVFKYRVPFNVIIRTDLEPKTRQLNKESVNGEVQYNLTVGQNYLTNTVHGETGAWEGINLTTFGDKLIEAIFGDVIRANKVEYVYVTASHLSGAYANYVMG